MTDFALSTDERMNQSIRRLVFATFTPIAVLVALWALVKPILRLHFEKYPTVFCNGMVNLSFVDDVWVGRIEGLIDFLGVLSAYVALVLLPVTLFLPCSRMKIEKHCLMAFLASVLVCSVLFRFIWFDHAYDACWWPD